MEGKLLELLELPAKTKVAILAGILLLLVGGYWYFFYSAVNEELSGLQESIEGPKGLRAQIAQREGIAKNLDKFMTEVQKLDVELKKALDELPDKREIYQLLSRVSDKARSTGLEIRLFKPQQEQKKDFYAEVPVEIEVAGTYHQLATFFDEVGRLERIVNLDQISVTEPYVNEGRVSVKTQVVATSFRFLDESERPKPEDKRSSKRRNRNKK
jgi:type IV pilus assembly protein PilO